MLCSSALLVRQAMPSCDATPGHTSCKCLPWSRRRPRPPVPSPLSRRVSFALGRAMGPSLPPPGPSARQTREAAFSSSCLRMGLPGELGAPSLPHPDVSSLLPPQATPPPHPPPTHFITTSSATVCSLDLWSPLPAGAPSPGLGTPVRACAEANAPLCPMTPLACPCQLTRSSLAWGVVRPSLPPSLRSPFLYWLF